MHEHDQIAEDIQYLEYLISIDKEQIKKQILTRLDPSRSIQEQLEGVSNEISVILAQMSARISIVEKELMNNPVNNQPSTMLDNSAEKVDKLLSSRITKTNKPVKMLEEINLSIVNIGEANKLGYLNHTQKNIPFHYLKPDSKISFELPINRSVRQTLAVNILDVSHQRLLQQVCFSIDGHVLKHKTILIEGKPRLICYLPKSTTGNITHVKLSIPSSVKDQKFVFTLSDVNCVPKQKLLSAIAQKLGIK